MRVRNLALVLSILSVVGAGIAWRHMEKSFPQMFAMEPQALPTKVTVRHTETEEERLARVQKAEYNAKLEAFLKERGRSIPNLFAVGMLGEGHADFWTELSERKNDPLAMLLLSKGLDAEESSSDPFAPPSNQGLAAAKRFQELEPDNAYADLLLLQSRRGDETLTGREIVELLVGAARKTRFDSHAQEFEMAALDAESACSKRLRDAWSERMRIAPGPGSFTLETLGEMSLPLTWYHMITMALEEKDSPTYIADPGDRIAVIRATLALIELAKQGPSELHGQKYAQEMREALTYGLMEAEHMEIFEVSINEAKTQYHQEQTEDLNGLFRAAIHLASEAQIKEMDRIYHSHGLAEARRMLIGQMDRHALEERVHRGDL